MYKRPPIMSSFRAVTPAEAQAKHQEKLKPILEKLLDKLNGYAIESNGMVFNYHYTNTEYQFYYEVKRIFEEAGWSVKVEDDQRESDSWWNFTAKS